MSKAKELYEKTLQAPIFLDGSQGPVQDARANIRAYVEELEKQRDRAAVREALMEMHQIERELVRRKFARIINQYGLDNECDTPDYILAAYLQSCLDNYSKVRRETYRHEGR